MKTLIVLIFVFSFLPFDLSAQSGAEILKGCKFLLELAAHDCKNQDCDHFAKDDVLQAVGTFQYISGFVSGVRTSQAIGKGPRLVDFPKTGVDCHTLIEPMIKYLESDPGSLNDHASVCLYAFLIKRYPGRKN